MKRFFTFLKTELKLSVRDMNMPIFAVIMPLAVFVILGIIYGTKPAYDDADYTFLEQSFGAAGAIAICAGGLMGLPQAVSGLRELKILKRFRVTPVSPVFVLGVELSMYIVYCIVSLVTLAAAALLWGVRLRGSLLAFLGSWALTMLSTLSIGMLVGGVAKDSKQASVIASILYFPMLIFSGTTLPIEVMPPVMQQIVSFFPLTQGLTLMKHTFLGIGTGSVLLPEVIGVMAEEFGYCEEVAHRFHQDMIYFSYGLAILANTGHLHLTETELREAFRREFRALAAIYGKPAKLPPFAVKAGVVL